MDDPFGYRGEMRRAALVCAVVLASPAAPAWAGAGGADGLSVTIPDVALTGYECSTGPVTVRADDSLTAPWVLAVSAAPVGRAELDRLVFVGIGGGQMSGSLLICPADSTGEWQATVQSQVLTSHQTYTVAFTVGKLATTTTVRSARRTGTALRVRGSVRAENGVPGRSSLAIRGRWLGEWRLLGHTNARSDGRFRFVAPRRADRVRIEYLGDSATMPSRAAADVVRISTSSSL